MDVVNVSILPVNCLFGSSIETYCNRGVLSLKYTEAKSISGDAADPQGKSPIHLHQTIITLTLTWGCTITRGQYQHIYMKVKNSRWYRSMTLTCRKLITDIVCLSDRLYTGFFMSWGEYSQYKKRPTNWFQTEDCVDSGFHQLPISNSCVPGSSLDQYIGLFLDRLPYRSKRTCLFLLVGNP